MNKIKIFTENCKGRVSESLQRPVRSHFFQQYKNFSSSNFNLFFLFFSQFSDCLARANFSLSRYLHYGVSLKDRLASE